MFLVEEIKKIITRLESFEFRLVGSALSIEGFGEWENYDTHVSQLFHHFESQLKEILKLTNKAKKLEYLQQILDSILDMKIREIDLKKYPYEIWSEPDEGYSFKDPENRFHLEITYNGYLKIKDRLFNSFQSIILKEQYLIDSGTVYSVSPDDTPTSKNRFTTKFTANQLGYFLYILHKNGIFGATNKSDIARMISENFVNEKQEHFSKDSIANKMKDNPPQSDIETVKKELSKLFNLITSV